jgi:hypothetical protein
MKKVIKLTESDLTNIIKRVLNEQTIKNLPKQSGQVYPTCSSNKYHKGCFGDEIKKVQTCLGIKNAKGNFGPKTENMLKTYFPDKKYHISFTDSDIATICKGKKQGSNVLVSDTINPSFVKQIDFSKLDTTKKVENICEPNDEHCAQFVNDFSNKFDKVGNAWNAYANDSELGPTVYSSFKGLDQNQIKKAIDLWTKIYNKGGGVKNGQYLTEIKKFVEQLVPKNGSNVNLELDDVVGIFYPPSSHHEEAFYQGGERWFTKGPNGKMIPGNQIKSGNGWGMNTHVGIVGAIKDGVPLIFHNISGNVISEPASNLRIAWVKRKGGTKAINPKDVKEKGFWDFFS